MAIGSADNDIIDCTDIAEFYCWPAFLSRSCGPHGPFHLAGDDVDYRLSRETRKTRGLTVRWKREHEPTDRPGSTNGAAVSVLATTLSWIGARAGWSTHGRCARGP